MGSLVTSQSSLVGHFPHVCPPQVSSRRRCHRGFCRLKAPSMLPCFLRLLLCPFILLCGPRASHESICHRSFKPPCCVCALVWSPYVVVIYMGPLGTVPCVLAREALCCLCVFSVAHPSPRSPVSFLHWLRDVCALHVSFHRLPRKKQL